MEIQPPKGIEDRQEDDFNGNGDEQERKSTKPWAWFSRPVSPSCDGSSVKRGGETGDKD